ncbi:DUF6300 family protein [Streptomyces longispororuber]|uniref:DUF6300 family protein n=1 Tax=Streptomyces longispororuber TaxID=68230 RepID=UPI0034038C7F
MCSACDTGQPAAAALIQFFADGGGRDGSGAEQGARLMWAWAREGLATYGWCSEEGPPS